MGRCDFVGEAPGGIPEFETRNLAHKLAGTSEERRKYYPQFGQQYFDTDVGKLLICTDPAKRKWVDAWATRRSGQAIGSGISAESPARGVARARLFSMEWKCFSRTERRICFNGMEMLMSIGTKNIFQWN